MSDCPLPHPDAPGPPERDVEGDLVRLLTRVRAWPLKPDRERRVIELLDRIADARREGREEDVGFALDALATLAPPQANQRVEAEGESSAEVGEQIDRMLSEPPPAH